MNIENKVYFAPGIEFKAVDWNDWLGLIEGFKRRVHAYYIAPAYNMRLWLPQAKDDPAILLGVAFGCGVICCTTIDFLARVESQIDYVRKRYVDWLIFRIPGMDMIDPDNPGQKIADRFYDEFRNGLIHEGRIKKAGQFSINPALFAPSSQIISIVDHAMVVNPFNLLDATIAALDNYSNDLLNDVNLQKKFANFLKTVFTDDINYANRS